MGIGQILTAVEVLSNGDLWIGATCGRVWPWVASTQTWVDHKTQTDADIRRMMFLSPTRGYFAALGGQGTNQVLVRYQAQ